MSTEQAAKIRKELKEAFPAKDGWKLIVIGGAVFNITTDSKMTKTDEHGIQFATRFIIAKALWDGYTVYARVTPHDYQIIQRFETIEDMRAAYKEKLSEGWIPA